MNQNGETNSTPTTATKVTSNPAASAKRYGSRRLAAVATFVAAGLLTAGCATGPSTLSEVCAGYDSLSQQVLSGNGIIGNPLFREAKSLGGLAIRYDGNAGVKADGEALKAIGESDSTSITELSGATKKIAAACGKPPLAINAVTGNKKK